MVETLNHLDDDSSSWDEVIEYMWKNWKKMEEKANRNNSGEKSLNEAKIERWTKSIKE